MTHEGRLVESHVDYITASCLYDKLPHASEAEAGWHLSNDILESERRRGNKLTPAKLFAFDGYKAGQIFVGQSERGFITRMSGRLAARHWREVYRHSTSVSRLDCAMTIKLEGCWTDLTRTHHDEALRYKAQSAPHLRVTRIDGGTHGNTLNIGSRSSDAYCRIYDKERESKSSLYQDCWRYELECKKERAQLVASQLDSDEADQLLPARVVVGWLARRGVMSVGFAEPLPDTSGGRHVTDNERRLSWLQAQVRPSLAHLISEVGLERVLCALGLRDTLPLTARESPAGADTQSEV